MNTFPHTQHIIAPDPAELAAAQEALSVHVTDVFDGDGFLGNLFDPNSEAWLSRVPFRFAFIDAPEIGQPFASEAKQFLISLIAAKSIEIIPVVKGSAGETPFDAYRRVLCMGFVTEEVQIGRVDYLLNGARGAGRVKSPRSVVRNVELEMIINGWAWVLQQYAFDREAEYRSAQEDAKRHSRGLWATNNPEPPWKFKQRQKRRRVEAARQPSLL